MRSRATGNRLRELRLASDLTQAQVADHLGLTKGAVSRHEHGKARVSDEHKVAYARLYAVSVVHAFPQLDTEPVAA